MVQVDHDARTYVAPHYFIEQDVPLPVTSEIFTVKEARNLGYESKDECRNLGYFTEDSVSLLRDQLERIGIIPERLHRWNSDGAGITNLLGQGNSLPFIK